jgi:hypothetical protein
VLCSSPITIPANPSPTPRNPAPSAATDPCPLISATRTINSIRTKPGASRFVHDGLELHILRDCSASIPGSSGRQTESPPFSVCESHRVFLVQEVELRLRIDEAPDQPWTGNAINLDVLACNPFHQHLATTAKGRFSVNREPKPEHRGRVSTNPASSLLFDSRFLYLLFVCCFSLYDRPTRLRPSDSDTTAVDSR